MQGKPRLACRPCTVDPPICLTSCTQWRRTTERGQAEVSAGQHNSPSICRQMVTARRSARPGRRPVSRALPLRPLDSTTSAGRASSAGSQARVSAQGRCLTASGSAGRSKYTPIGCASLRRCPPGARRQTISAFEPTKLQPQSFNYKIYH